MQIELHSAKHYGETVRVNYVLFDQNSESEVQQDLDTESLLNFIIDNGYNTHYFAFDPAEPFNYPAETILSNELNYITNEYLKANLTLIMKTKNQSELNNELKMALRIEAKSPRERAEVLTAQSNFKRNGLYEWNERNRPGNNRRVSK